MTTPVASRPTGPELTEPSAPGTESELTPRSVVRGLVYRLLHPRGILLDTRRPIEVPVVTETKRLWNRREREAAIRYAYDAVLADVQRAFGVTFPSDWTNEEILVLGMTPEMAPVPEFLHALLIAYEPIRYGGMASAATASPEALLLSIYSHPKMWALYLAEVPVTGGPAPSATPSGGSSS